MTLFNYLIAAFAIERLITLFKRIFVDKKVQWQVILSMLFGIGLAFNLNLDIFASLGMEEKCTIVGIIVTGIGLSGGSNFVYECYKTFKGWQAGKFGEEGQE